MSSMGRRITLTQDNHWWVAKDEQTGVASQGDTRELALENLDDALAGYEGAGESPTDEDLRALGIDPEKNVSGHPEASEIFE